MAQDRGGLGFDDIYFWKDSDERWVCEWDSSVYQNTGHVKKKEDPSKDRDSKRCCCAVCGSKNIEMKTADEDYLEYRCRDCGCLQSSDRDRLQCRTPILELSNDIEQYGKKMDDVETLEKVYNRLTHSYRTGKADLARLKSELSKSCDKNEFMRKQMETDMISTSLSKISIGDFGTDYFKNGQLIYHALPMTVPCCKICGYVISYERFL